MDDPRPVLVRSIGRRRPAGKQTAVKARPVPLARHFAAGDALRLTMLECLAQVCANAGAMRAGRDPETLHQLRVGLRRLQVALSGFGEESRSPAHKELRERTRAIASRLGPARDLDVFLGQLLRGPRKDAGDDESFALLKSRAETARETAWDGALECVASADFAIFLDDVAAEAERKPMYADRPLRVRKAADRVLETNFKRAKKRGRQAKSRGAMGDFHRLRIALKKLRYAAEFFARLYRGRDMQRYMKELRELQDCLGHLNDAAHLRTTLAQLLEDDAGRHRAHGDLCFAAGQVEGWHRARAPGFTRDALRRWTRFKRHKPFWH